MATARQQIRTKIVTLVDEMISGLIAIQKTALHHDQISIITQARTASHEWNNLIAMYAKLDELPDEPQGKSQPQNKLKLN